jgi:hypothetical protein
MHSYSLIEYCNISCPVEMRENDRKYKATFCAVIPEAHPEETRVMSIVSIPVPADLEHVLKPVLDRDPEKGAEWLRAGFEARLAELYQQWQALRISTARFAELLGVSPWELDDLLRVRDLKVTNLPG